MESYPSIFNDVIGPVMRGPSSSHCAASLRIGRLCRDLMEGDIREVLIEFDPNGSLATTHKGQGSDMGLFGGFLGWEAYDERLPDYLQAVDAAGIKINIDIHPIGATHPNTYKITLKNNKETHTLTALSTGGGMIQVIEIDGASVFMAGSLPIFLLTFGSIRVSPEIMMSWLGQNLSQYLAAGVVIATINQSHNHLRVAPPRIISVRAA